jgi:butyryl-CoA dehydrogenase
MSYNLTDEQAQWREKARAFAEKEIAPVAAQMDREAYFPDELYQKMCREDFLRMTIPREYGGLDISTLAYVTVAEEISRYCGSTGVIMAATTSLVDYPIVAFGNEDQKKKYLPKLGTGEMKGAFALTEESAGSDAANQGTTAMLDGDHYVVNGQKIYITNGDVASVIVLVCKIVDKDKPDGRGKVSALLVDVPAEGFSFRKYKTKMGIRASSTAELTFKDVIVPKENLLGEPGKGFRIAMKTLDGGRIGVAGQALGIAIGAFDAALSYAKKREQFGKPIANFQAIQWMIADMSTLVEAARGLTYRAAAVKDSGENCAFQAAQAKLYASEVASKVTDMAVQVHGGKGYIGELAPAERFYRDARITRIYEGTSEVQRLVIASSLLR